jgi:YHS domain-containing protein
MTVEPSDTAIQDTHAGVTYYFCSPACHDQFLADPDHYTSHPARTA